MASGDGVNEVPFAIDFSIAEVLKMPQQELKKSTGICPQDIKCFLEPITVQFQTGIQSVDFRIACFNQKASSVNKSHAEAISQLEKEIEDLRATNKSQRSIIRKLERATKCKSTASISQHHAIKDLLSSAKEKETAYEELSSMSKDQSSRKRPLDISGDETEEFAAGI